MSDLDAQLWVRNTAGRRSVRLADYLDAAAEEAAARQANAWIKALRHARIGTVTFRERFTYRDDSLWWFAELFLHKSRTVLSLFRALNAAAGLLDREAPASLEVDRADDIVRHVLVALAHARGIEWVGASAAPEPRSWLLAMDARSTALLAAAVASPGRPWRAPAISPTVIAAFIHRAFWRGDGADGGGEAYIGPVLRTLERRLPAGSIAHVGVGPVENFRARRWWRRGPDRSGRVQPIERLVPRVALAGASGLWAARHAMRRALSSSADLRSAAVIRGCDCWRFIEPALAGVALLQFPWSARAMDEAGAALDALQPSAALTYAEAGGWGRALSLEARRRRIPLVGLQHGFIYRHWLNYLHEQDEMDPLPGSGDQGFPRPTVTLVFDEYAATHLTRAGRFPPESVTITGSPRLDELADTYRNLTDDAAGETAGTDDSSPVVLLVTKYTEAARILPHLLNAFDSMTGERLVIKTHPAETPEPYETAAAGRPNVTVLPGSAPLAPLLRACQLVVTVNSTVALDAIALGIPALAIGLPNNLTPFVEVGAIAGAARPDEIGSAIRRLLYDREFRQQFRAMSASVAAKLGMIPSGGAADKQASIILGLARVQA